MNQDFSRKQLVWPFQSAVVPGSKNQRLGDKRDLAFMILVHNNKSSGNCSVGKLICPLTPGFGEKG